MNAALGQSEMKRISLAPESTFDCSSSLFSTLDSGEISPIIKPNPPLKKLKTTNSTMTSALSSSSESIIGDIHPSNMDLDNLDDLSNLGSPLDRSTPISDYEMGVNETEVGTGTLDSSGSPPVHHRKIYSNRNHHLQSEQKTTGSAHHLPGTSCKYTISNSLSNGVQMRGANMGCKCGAHMLGTNVGHAVLGANVVLGTHIVLGAEHVTNQWDQSGSPKNTKSLYYLYIC